MPSTKTDGPSNAELVQWMGGSIQDLTIATAERVLKGEVGSGFTTTPTVVTDGVVRRDYHDVKPFGRIEFIAQPDMRDAVLWALAQLKLLSPVRSGRYRDSHVILINGEGKTGTEADQALLAAKLGDRVQIVNTRPYARKIEGQRAKRRKKIRRRRGLSKEAPNGVYRVVAQLVIQRWGRSIFTDYKLVPLEIAGITATASGKHRSASGFYTYPALQFFIKA